MALEGQFSSVTQLCPTLCDPMDCSTPGLPVHHQLPEPTQLMSIESVMPSNHLILCRPLLLLPSVFPSIRVFSKDSALGIRWPKDGLTWSTERSSTLGLRTAKDTPAVLSAWGCAVHLLGS